jgi:hypothetical protein
VGMLGCLHLSLVLIEETVVSCTGGAEWASRLEQLQLQFAPRIHIFSTHACSQVQGSLSCLAPSPNRLLVAPMNLNAQTGEAVSVPLPGSENPCKSWSAC